MSSYEVLPGAEAWEHTVGNGAPGALVLHGFTGNPSSMRGLAEAFAAAGFNVSLPRLPGHGTAVEDMLTTSWADWSAHAESAYLALAGRSSSVVVAGLSMGGTLTLWLAENHPDIAGIVCVNAAADPGIAELRAGVQAMVDAGEETMDGIGSDVAKEGVAESAYAKTPLRPLISLADAVVDVAAKLGSITCPVLVCTSPNDHVVAPVASDIIASTVAGPVTRVILENSFHVATIDHDAGLIESEAVAFARKVTAPQ